MPNQQVNRRGVDHHHARMVKAGPLNLRHAGFLGARQVDSTPTTPTTDSPNLTSVPDENDDGDDSDPNGDDDFPFVTSSSSSSVSLTATPTSSSLTSSAPTTTSSSISSSNSININISSSSSASAILSTARVEPTQSVASPITSVARVTHTTHIQSSSGTLSASASSTGAPTSNGNTSTVVGAIAAGLVGLAGLIFATMFFLRRWRKRREETNDFNADTFRQSAVLIDDEPAAFGAGRSYNPRPPTMIERHLANRTPFDAPPVPSLHQHYNGGGAGGYVNEYDYPAAPQQAFSPGQVMHSRSPPPTQNGTQFFAYGQSPTSPTSYNSGYNENGQLVRQPSNGAAIHNGQAQLSRQDSMGGNSHYVDLDRSSVTPFQAAQYAEISRQLNTKPQGNLSIVTEGEEPAQYATGHAFSPEDNINQRSPFGDSHGAQELAPPSPIYSMNSPRIPELQAQGRAFSPTSYDFPQTPSAIPTPSPSVTNFSITGPQAGERVPNSLMPGATHNQTTGAEAERIGLDPKPLDKRPPSTYTVYDEADAYGGF